MFDFPHYGFDVAVVGIHRDVHIHKLKAIEQIHHIDRQSKRAIDRVY